MHKVIIRSLIVLFFFATYHLHGATVNFWGGYNFAQDVETENRLAVQNAVRKPDGLTGGGRADGSVAFGFDIWLPVGEIEMGIGTAYLPYGGILQSYYYQSPDGKSTFLSQIWGSRAVIPLMAEIRISGSRFYAGGGLGWSFGIGRIQERTEMSLRPTVEVIELGPYKENSFTVMGLAGYNLIVTDSLKAGFEVRLYTRLHRTEDHNSYYDISIVPNIKIEFKF
jgi:hypothetical protein